MTVGEATTVNMPQGRCISITYSWGRSVHRNIDICRQLQREAQAAYERTHTRREFIDLIGRSYL